ncbi:helix-turn-helix domain-containing protein [Streptomyces sp. NPDC006393]|uniref:winged helix-turn-helix transcriptional regulator n=1 Tax=Streptomyces sp. NPDC006393 TaxID=3156763 RepID=UPI0033EEDF91
MNPRRAADDACGIAQAAAVVGDWRSLLVLREIARGHVRFDQFADELALSRKILAQRLRMLTEHHVPERRRYQDRPPRYDYVLTEQGRGLPPVLVSLQDRADRWLPGDGTLTGRATDEGGEARRVASLVGERVPTGLRLTGTDGEGHDPVAPLAALHVGKSEQRQVGTGIDAHRFVRAMTAAGVSAAPCLCPSARVRTMITDKAGS